MEVVPEGRTHMVHGTTDCACDQGRETCWRKFCLAHGLGEDREDDYFVFVGEGIKEGIVLEIDLLEKLLETDSSAILFR